MKAVFLCQLYTRADYRKTQQLGQIHLARQYFSQAFSSVFLSYTDYTWAVPQYVSLICYNKLSSIIF